MNKFITKENIIVVIVTIIMIAQSNYFATKLDIANLKLELAQQKIELKKYADDGDKELLHNLDGKYQLILNKLDKIKG
jgi:hypothetical protein|nr:MAG TPA: Protein of unknown function (DUF1043) [Caudoviricetes sp.]